MGVRQPCGAMEVVRAASGSDPTILMTKQLGGTRVALFEEVGKTLKPLRITFPTLIDLSVVEVFANYC